ncbi:MAG: hypothetical protein C0605_06730, partial [Hyphomicrobiales bacterium]
MHIRLLSILAASAAFFAVAADAEEAIVTSKSLTLEAALEVAQGALAACRKDGYQIAVSVIDRGGNQQVNLRDRLAGPHTTDTAYRKAWTAVSFRTDTSALAKTAEAGPAWAIRGVTNALPLGGGVLIRDGDGTMLGAVG